MSKTKVDIVSGFLGAGKTTFIKRLLEEVAADEQVVLIENEFGEIGIDGGFLKDSGIEIKEMNSGCICCSLVGDFSTSLNEIITKYSPDRIIIEPSGVGKLSDVMRAVTDVESELGIDNNSAITVVDVKKCKLYIKNFGEFFNNQIEYATTIVLSRTDISKPEVIEEAVAMIRQLNKTAVIITTPIELLPTSKILEILETPMDLSSELIKEVEEHEHHHDHEEHEHHHDHEGHEHHHDHAEHEHHHDHEEHEHHHDHAEGETCDCGCGNHEHHHHHADDVFTSWGLEQVPSITQEKLKFILDKLSETTEYGCVLRAKGMIPETDTQDWLYFDLVPGEVEIRKGTPDYTGKVCVIGTDIKEDELTKEFK